MAMVLTGREPLGTAGEVRAAAEDGRFGGGGGLVLYETIAAGVDPVALAEEHARSGAVVTLAAARVVDAERHTVVLAGRDGRVHGLQHRPHPAEALSDLAFAGALAFEPEVFDHFPAGVSDWAADVLPALLEDGVHVQVHEARRTP